MRLIFTISKSVFKESFYGQLFYGLLVFLFIFLCFCVYISSLSLGDVGRVIANTGMLGISLLSLTCTILFGLYSLYQERERNELYVLLCRVPRSHYLLGRFLGTTNSEIPFTPVGAPSILASMRWTIFSTPSWSPAEIKIFWPVIM